MNALVKQMKQQNKSIRQIAKEIGVSHAHVAKIFRGEAPVTWQFASIVAQKTGIDYLEAFRLAGLLPEEKK
jgi:transcriptional regulator with XRE-family HTH domain